jgi:cytoskeletal protein RodZ
MNKKYISIILSVLLIFSIAFAIAGCNKDDATIPSESTDAIRETEQTTEESSIEETESVTDEKVTESTSQNDETETESSTNPTETTTENTKPAVCETCGGLIVDESDTNLPLVGNYCDGYCDEWIGF